MSAKSKLTAAQKKNIRDMYDAGIDREIIAQRYAISAAYVGAIYRCYESSGNYVSRNDRVLRTSITPQMIAKVKKRIHPGTKVICLDKEEHEDRTVTIRKRRCRVIDTYPYIFTVQRTYGIESFAYTDLIRQDGVKENMPK